MPTADPSSPAALAVLQLASDLEEALKAITRDKREHKGLNKLIQTHSSKFSDQKGLAEARIIRNCIIHRDPITDAQVQRAEAAFQTALEEILPHCPEAFGERLRKRSHSPVGATTGTAGNSSAQPPVQQPLDFSETSEESANSAQPRRSEPPEPERSTPPPVGATPHYQPGAQTTPAAKPLQLWYVLAAAFVLLAAFAFVVRPKVTQSQPSVTLPPGQPITKSLPPPVAQPTTAQAAAPAVEAPKTPNRDEQFRAIINTNLSLSASQPNVALVILPTGSENSTSVSDILQGLLADSRLHFIGNLADLVALKQGGFFDDMYAGNGRFLGVAAQLAHVDYILLGNASYSFRPQPELNPDLITCELTVSARLADHNGTMVRSGSFSAPGPGFSQQQALERAAENVARQLKEKMLDSIPPGE